MSKEPNENSVDYWREKFENLSSRLAAVERAVTELAKDDKGLLAKALAENQVFMDRQTQTVLKHLRDALSS